MITIKDLADTYGSLNNIEADPGLSADRRVTTPTDALSIALEAAFTPDALKNKNTFMGIVMMNYPTKIPRQGSKQELFHTPTAFEETDDGSVPTKTFWPYYTVYKVYIPELEPRVLNFDAPNKDGSISMLHRVMTFDDVIPNEEILTTLPGPIRPGTIVSVQYEDMSRLKNPRIVGVAPEPAFDIDLATGQTRLRDKWNDLVPSTVFHPPAGFYWSDKAKYQKRGTSAGATVYNGELEATGLLDTWEDTQLLKEAMDDWKKLAAAFKTKFGKKLHGSGYRTYRSQVQQREKRAKGDAALMSGRCKGWETHSKCTTGRSGCRAPDNSGNGEFNKDCKFIGMAAVPGQSNHGWGCAVDINTDNWNIGEGTNGAEFRWLNKYARTPSLYGAKHGWVFTAPGEKWHLTWIGLSTVLVGTTVKKTSWSPEGVSDDDAKFTGIAQAGNFASPYRAPTEPHRTPDPPPETPS